MKIISFIARSSADPKKFSLTIKSILLGAIPFAMQATGIACALGAVCIDLDEGLIERLIDALAETVFLGLSLIASIGASYGFIRKLYRTFNGENLAIK